MRVLVGDAAEMLGTLGAESVQTCITSPPYWGLRNYGHDGQIGQEDTPEAYVARLVDVFREVRRVLRDDGTLWLNLGDSYAGGGGYAPDAPANKRRAEGDSWGAMNAFSRREGAARKKERPGHVPSGLKPKDLVGIPWRVAFALQADGWFLRSDIIWHKPNPMPSSARDRPTSAHEYIFLLSKRARYYYDADAIAEAANPANYRANPSVRSVAQGQTAQGKLDARRGEVLCTTRNRRSVWTVTNQPFNGAHFAVFPPELITPCVLAGSARGDTVLDPFTGSGTTGVVALQHGREFVGVELNPDFAEMARGRMGQANVATGEDAAADLPLFGGVA